MRTLHERVGSDECFAALLDRFYDGVATNRRPNQIAAAL
jgi:truncated hemoglobin YjbI